MLEVPDSVLVQDYSPYWQLPRRRFRILFAGFHIGNERMLRLQIYLSRFYR